MRAGERRFGGWRQPAAVALAALFVLPLWFLVAGSLREPGTVPPRTPELLPRSLSTQAYGDAFDLVDLGRYLVNSLVVAALTVPLAVLVASWTGFALLLLAGRARVVLLAVSFAALMIPVTALLVPRFTLYRWIGVTDTWVPLVAPALLGLSPFYVLLFYWSFRRLPPELVEAARLEDVMPFTMWRRLAMPLVRPVTVAVALLAFIASWGNFLEAIRRSEAGINIANRSSGSRTEPPGCSDRDGACNPDHVDPVAERKERIGRDDRALELVAAPCARRSAPSRRVPSGLAPIATVTPPFANTIALDLTCLATRHANARSTRIGRRSARASWRASRPRRPPGRGPPSARARRPRSYGSTTRSRPARIAPVPAAATSRRFFLLASSSRAAAE